MGIRIAVGAALALLAPSIVSAAMCPDRAPAPITSVSADALKCQKTIAKQGEKFLKAKLKAMSTCLLAHPLGECPDAAGAAAVADVVNKAASKIAGACGDDAAQGGLTSSYGTLTDDAVITSCMLSQHNVTGYLAAASAAGALTEASDLLDADTNKARAGCIKELTKSSGKYISKALKIADKCIAGQMKDGTAGDLAPICVGQYSGGAFVAPTDGKASKKQSDLVAKTEAKIESKCGDAVTLGYVASLFSCGGAATVQDLKDCIVCSGWNAVLDAVAQQYSETGTYIAPGPGAIQAGVTAGTTNARLLIGSGTYNEEVTISADGVQLIGCGGATNNRPKILPPGTPPDANGIFAAGVDRLLFQSLEVNDFDDNDIFVSAADGVTFRDTITRGPATAGVTAYGVFPVQSSNVLIEGCLVTGVSDAGIYVGQSTDIAIRYNHVSGNVAGIEIENSAHAEMHNNHAHDNSGGLLVFKLPGLPVQLSNCHHIHHNLSVANNGPNFGSGTVGLVPRGTGMIVLSNDDSVFEWNVARDNDTFGIAVTDQAVLKALFNAFVTLSPDQLLENNQFLNNVFSGNGGNPDPNVTNFAADALIVASVGSSGNCQGGNSLTSDFGDLFLALPSCGPSVCSVP